MSEQRPRSGTDWTTPGEGTDGGDDFRTPRGGGGGDDSHGGVRNRDAAAAQRRGALPPSTAGLKWRRRALEGEARYEWLLRRFPPTGRAELALFLTRRGVSAGRHVALTAALRRVGLSVACHVHGSGGGALLLLHASESTLQGAAERLGERLRLRWAAGGGRAAYTRAAASSFIGYDAAAGAGRGSGASSFSPSIRLSLIERLISDDAVGAGVDLVEEIVEGHLANGGAVPLHDRKLAEWVCGRVGRLWPPSQWTLWPIVDHERFRALREEGQGFLSALMEAHALSSSSLVIDDICFYQGHQTAIYVLFMSFLASQMAPLALIGICVWMARMTARAELDEPHAGRVASSLDVGFALVVSLWATAVLQLWERREARFAVRWGGGHNAPAEDNPRPEFRALKTKANPRGLQVLATGEVVRHYPLARRKAKQMVSAVIFLALMSGVTALMYFCFYVWFETDDLGLESEGEEEIDLSDLSSLRRFLPTAIVFGLVIPILTYAAEALAAWLTDWENYRLQAHHDDAIIAKTFGFNMLAMYFTVFVIAFGHVELSCLCVPQSKLEAVSAQLYSQVGALTVVRCFITDTAKTIAIWLVATLLRYITQRRFEEMVQSESSAETTCAEKWSWRAWSKWMLHKMLALLYPKELLESIAEGAVELKDTIAEGAVEFKHKVKYGAKKVGDALTSAIRRDVESGDSDHRMFWQVGSDSFHTAASGDDRDSDAEADALEEQADAYGQAAAFKVNLRLEYSEMMLLLGFALLFSSIFPLMPLICTVNWWLELRLDCGKFMRYSQRPFTYRVGSIGVWKRVLGALSLGGVLTNLAVILVTVQGLAAIKDVPASEKLMVAVGVEHLVLLLKAVIRFALPKVPRDVREEARRQQVVRARGRVSGGDSQVEPTTI